MHLVCTVYRQGKAVYLRCPAEYFQQGAVYKLAVSPPGGGPAVVIKTRVWRAGPRIAYLYVYSAYRPALEELERVAVSL